MVLGLGRAKEEISDAVGMEEDGDTLTEMGFFSTTITKEQFSGPLDGSTVNPDQGRWVNLLFYEVGAQEQFVIGSKSRKSEQIGKVNIDLQPTGNNDGTDGETVPNARVRVGYETSNGRASYPVFTRPSEVLTNTDREQLIQKAPERWALKSDGPRNGIAAQEDRIFINGYFTGDYELDNADTVVQLPGMLKEE